MLIAIPYSFLTKQAPSMITAVLDLEEGDLTAGVFLDRSVPGGMNLQDVAVSYEVQFQASPDGTNWFMQSGFTQYGGVMLSGSGIAEDPFYVTQYDGTNGDIPPGTRHMRAVITGHDITTGSPVGIFGFLSSSPNPDASQGWPQ